MYIILIKFESLFVCVYVSDYSSYTFEVRTTNDISKSFLDPEECFIRIYYEIGAILCAPLPNYGTHPFLNFFIY